MFLSLDASMTRRSIATTKLLQVAALALALHIGTHGYANNVQAYFTTSVNEGTVPLTVTFDAAEATGSGNLSFTWNFRDGTSAEGERVEHTFNHAGRYEVVLTVRSGDEMHSVYKKIRVLPTESVLDQEPEFVWDRDSRDKVVTYLQWRTENSILNNGLEKLFEYIDRDNLLDFAVVNQLAPDRSWVSFNKRAYSAYSGADRFPVSGYSDGNILIYLSTGQMTSFPSRVDGIVTSGATVSPDAKTMIISQSGNLYIMDVATAYPELLFKGDATRAYGIGNVSFKPDASEIAFSMLYGGTEGSGSQILPSYVLRIPISLRNGDISDATVVREYQGTLPLNHELFWQGDDVIVLTKKQKLQ